MVRNLLVFLVLMGFVFSFLPPVVATVDYCQVINAPGEYTLTKDLIGVNDSNSYCIQIEVGDVVLDCDGHTITGTGAGEGVVFKSGSQPNITVKNCNISNYEYGIFGDPYNSSVLNNDVHNNILDNMNIGGSYNQIDDNLFHHSGDDREGAHVNGDYNIFTGNEFYYNGRAGLSLVGYHNELDENDAYNNDESGFSISGDFNNLTENTAYHNDWEYFEGAGFESQGVNTFDDNTAYGNTNGFYIEGYLPEPAARRPLVFGNTFTNNWAYDNLVGLNFIDWNGTYTDNTLEENLEMDLLIAGDTWLGIDLLGSELRDRRMTDWTLLCDNTVEDNTGSGARPIYFSGETVTLNGGTYSEIILCNATNSVVTGVTADGSYTLDNNGLILLLSNGTKISDSTSQNNFMGFGFVRSSDASLSNSNADGSGFGLFSLQTMDLNIDRLTSNNNRMNATIILDILLGFLGGGPLAGGDTMRAPAPEIHEIGAGAVLVQSPRATITDSTFSGSTFGLALMMSDEATISGGSAHTNDVFGYGLLDSYNVNFESFALAYNNAGDIHDIFIGRVPPAYETLEFLPFGVGVLDLSLGILMPATSRGTPLRISETCHAYADCDVPGGEICNFTTHTCEAGTFENTFDAMRSYDNNYGMVLLSRGHEIVDGSRIYDNSVLGILDASYLMRERLALGGVTLPPSPNDAITIRDSYLYRNGETMFSTLSDVFEEGGKPTWADAFELIDEVLPKGVLELEVIEASYIYSLGDLTAETSKPHWKLEETTLGTGSSSVRVSLDDNATAMYILSDTTLPTLESLHVESEEFELNTTLYLEIDSVGLGPRTSYNDKYFIVGALQEGRVLAAPVTPSIDEFTVHYGSAAGYDPSTMALYYLKMVDQGVYCEDDLDCARGEFCWVEENMCEPSPPDCINDSDCLDPGSPYCDGYHCVACLENGDCTGICEVCVDGKCTGNDCIADIDCNDGCECPVEPSGIGRCKEPRVRGAESCGIPVLEEGVVTLRASVAEEQYIFKMRWAPVEYQIHNETEKAITIYNFSQNDRSEFMDMLLGSLPAAAGIDPSEMSLYFDIYGLFAVRGAEQPPDGGEKPDYVCEEDVDCPECYYCSIGNNECLPKTDVECGVPGTGCSNGYECVACECVKEAEPPEEGCETDNDCPGNEYCDDGECMPVSCECGEVKDHECVGFECCSDEECDAGLVCKDNNCVEPEEDKGCDECDEPITQSEGLINDAREQGLDTTVVDELLEKAKEAKERGDCEEALQFANAALAAAQDLLGEEEAFPVPVISTEVPSVDQPQLPNGTEVTEWQQDIAWAILLILGLALVGYWWFRNHYGK